MSLGLGVQASAELVDGRPLLELEGARTTVAVNEIMSDVTRLLRREL